MDKKNIDMRVCTIIAEVLRVSEDRITSDARFREDLGADSLDLVTLLMALEEEFGGSISNEEASGMTTVGQAVTIISTFNPAVTKVETHA